MAQIIKDSQYISFALYFFCYCRWGVVQRFPPGVMKQPLEMPGRPTLVAAYALILTTGWTPMKH